MKIIKKYIVLIYTWRTKEIKRGPGRPPKYSTEDIKKKQALVKWKGYSDDFNIWIPFKDLRDI